MSFWVKVGRCDENASRKLYLFLQHPRLVRALQWVSWWGDGPLWVLLILGLPLVQGERGFVVGLSILMAALINVTCFRPIKKQVKRLRPFVRFPDIIAKTKAGGEFGFPSSHTVHAISFLVVLGALQPVLASIVGPLVILIAFSRVILGVHYLGDILAACVLGLLSGAFSGLFLAEYLAKAVTSFYV